MNRPEWASILVGCLACIVNGGAQPLFAVLLVLIIEVSKTSVFLN